MRRGRSKKREKGRLAVRLGGKGELGGGGLVVEGARRREREKGRGSCWRLAWQWRVAAMATCSGIFSSCGGVRARCGRRPWQGAGSGERAGEEDESSCRAATARSSGVGQRSTLASACASAGGGSSRCAVDGVRSKWRWAVNNAREKDAAAGDAEESRGEERKKRERKKRKGEKGK